MFEFEVHIIHPICKDMLQKDLIWVKELQRHIIIPQI
jgi:hypothetical protein